MKTWLFNNKHKYSIKTWTWLHYITNFIRSFWWVFSLLKKKTNATTPATMNITATIPRIIPKKETVLTEPICEIEITQFW